MKIPGFSLWALITAVMLYFLLHFVGMSEVVSGIFAVLWYIIGAGAAFAVMRFHHPHLTMDMKLSVVGARPEGYHTVTFTNQGRTIYVRPGANLRDAAVAQGVQIYYDINKYVNCFGTGHCGTCQFKADPKSPSALTELTWQERFTLGDEAGKLRLACQTHVLGDCVIDNTVAQEMGVVRHYSVINGALLGIFSLLMLGVILWMGGDMIGLF